MDEAVFEDFLKYFKACKGRIVIFTGAGISTSANIPDYRGTNGLYNKKKTKLPKLRLVEATSAKPTLTHMAIQTLVKNEYVRHVVSQNVDGLHLRSGLPREKLSEIHGNLFIEICHQCNFEFFRSFDVAETTGRSRHLTGRVCPRCAKDDLNVRIENLIKFYISKRANKKISKVSMMRMYRRAAFTLWSKDRNLPLLHDVIVHYFEKQNSFGLKTIYRLDEACKAVHGSQDVNLEIIEEKDEPAQLIICVGSSLTVLRNYSFLWPDGLGKSSKTLVNVDHLNVRLAINTLQPTCKDGLAKYLFRVKCDEFFEKLISALDMDIPHFDPNSHDQIKMWALPITEAEKPSKTREERLF